MSEVICQHQEGSVYPLRRYELELLSEIPLLEKKESVILYELNDYKLIFDSIASKVIKKMEEVKKSISQIIPQKKV